MRQASWGGDRREKCYCYHCLQNDEEENCGYNGDNDVFMAIMALFLDRTQH